VTNPIRPLIAGNWKMNGLRASLSEAGNLQHSLTQTPVPGRDVLICPPATLIIDMVDMLAGSGIAVGGQNCHLATSGAHTGDISAEMLADAGAAFVIVGHSERRADHGETDIVVKSKAGAGLRAGLIPIVCVGETEPERQAGVALSVVEKQLGGSLPDLDNGEDIVIAYEPVWAIGTGLTPTSDDVAEMHGAIRAFLTEYYEHGETIRILYGGSVKPSNAAELLAVPDVNGALVGGASLKAEDFYDIVSA
jgi:triosephosphate isomerase